MTQEARELLQKALALPDNEAELAGNLISSLDATVESGRRRSVAARGRAPSA